VLFLEKTSDQLYQEAYAAHYSERMYEKALDIYQQIIELYPDSTEAGYAKTQIKNIELMSYEQRKSNPVSSPAISENKKVTYSSPKMPGFAILFIWLGILSVIGGVIGAIVLWPNSLMLEPGYEYRFIAYVPGIAFLVSGIISAFIFWAFAYLIDAASDIRSTIYFMLEHK
jgi:tetratricopeptide (TPR) repeat protein